MSSVAVAESFQMRSYPTDLDSLDEAELLTRLMGSPRVSAPPASIKRALDEDAASVASPAILQAREVIEMARLLTEKRAARKIEGRIVTDHPKAVRDYLVARLGSARREELGCLYLDASFAVIRYERIAIGSTSEVTCHPREIARRCIELDSDNTILAHNHPSSSIRISPGDEELTKGVRQALFTLGITLLDHYLVAGNRCLSIRESMPELFDLPTAR